MQKVSAMKNSTIFKLRIIILLLAIIDSAYLLLIEQGMASCSTLGESTCLTILPVYSNHLFIPLPILGLSGYFLLLFVTIFAFSNRKILILRRLAGFGTFVFSIYLMSYMFLIVKNFCSFCTISFILILVFAILELIEFEGKKHRIAIQILVISIIIIIFGVFLVSKHYNPQENFRLNNEKFLSSVETLSNDYRPILNTSDKPIVVYIYSDGCKFCQYYTSEVLNSEKTRAALDNVRFFKLKIDSNHAFLKSIERNIKNVPTLVKWSRNKEIQYLTGVKSIKRVMKFIQQ